MFIDAHAGGFASRSNGFAARAQQHTGVGAASVAPRDEREPPHAGGRSGVSSSARAKRESADRGAVHSSDIGRVKRLATVSALSIAVAVVSLGYGAWALSASQAQAEAVRAGALPTLVAIRDIQPGEELTADLFETRDIPQAFRPQAALDSDALAEGGVLAGGRAFVGIPAGTPVAASFVMGAGVSDRLAASLASGKQAVTIGVDTETGLAGQVKAYDMVRIVSAESAPENGAFLETLCERARVISLDGEQGVEGGAYTAVTVEVTPEEADAVRAAQYAGRVSLVLLASTDVAQEAIDG